MKTTIFALLLSASVALAGEAISFQKLPVNDAISVKLTSTGCFHSLTYEFEFQRGETLTAKATQIELRWSKSERRMEVAKRIPLGSVALSQTELAGLDRLFAFYRSKKAGDCTTVDEITAIQKRGDVVKITESFTDKTCATYRMKDLTLLSAIVEKLKSESR